MELFLGVLFFTWILSKAVNDARLDHSYAKQGLVSPRLKAKYGGDDQATARVAKYGFLDHLRDAWRDYWPRRTEALIAARNARSANGGRVRLRDRIAAAQRRVVADPDLAEPGQPPVPTPAQPTVETPPAVGATPDTTDVPEPDPSPPVGGDPTTAEPDTDPIPSEPAPPAQLNGGTMTGPTGEVVNYETAIAEIDAAIADVTQRIDADQAAIAAFAEAKAALDAVQQGYQSAATAAQTKLDHQAALNLDGTTMGHAGTTVDAMPPNAVDGLYDQTEAVEQEIRTRLAQDEIALASLEAERAHLIGTYGDAHATVAGNLGGDSRFLDSGGTSPTGPAVGAVQSGPPNPAAEARADEPTAAPAHGEPAYADIN